jgi:nucleoid-associated protein YgaU
VRVLGRLGACVVALALCGVVLARVTPDDLPRSASSFPAWLSGGPVETRVVALAAVAAWACLAWLALVLVAVAAGAFPRGRVRDAAERVLGIAVVGVAAGALVAGPAAADGPFDRPAGPAASPPVTARAASPPPALPARSVVVAPGDTLWSIAARRLGARATAALTAATWPRWYAANRPRIGPDPGRLLPGQRLVPPPDGGER